MYTLQHSLRPSRHPTAPTEVYARPPQQLSTSPKPALPISFPLLYKSSKPHRSRRARRSFSVCASRARTRRRARAASARADARDSTRRPLSSRRPRPTGAARRGAKAAVKVRAARKSTDRSRRRSGCIATCGSCGVDTQTNGYECTR